MRRTGWSESSCHTHARSGAVCCGVAARLVQCASLVNSDRDPRSGLRDRLWAIPLLAVWPCPNGSDAKDHIHVRGAMANGQAIRIPHLLYASLCMLYAAYICMYSTQQPPDYTYSRRQVLVLARAAGAAKRVACQLQLCAAYRIIHGSIARREARAAGRRSVGLALLGH
jgi:hypothetical protein